MAAEPLTDAERERILELHRGGMGRNDIAREVGRSGDVVSRVVRDAGGTFDRAGEVAAATAAKAADNRARRQGLIERGYARAEKIYTRLEAEQFQTSHGTPDGIVTKKLDFVPAQDEKALAQAIGTHLANVGRLEIVDGGPGVDESRSLLQKLGDALGLTPPAGD